MHDKGKARTVIAVVFAGGLCASALSVAQAGDPHRPPTRGTIFIPIGKAKDAETAPAAKAEAASPIPTFAESAPAEAAWAAIPDAAQLANALRALVALDADKVRRAPDMASTVGAHLPRYRLPEAIALRAGPSTQSKPLMRLGAGELVILLTVEGDWQQVYVPDLHALGWRQRRVAAR